VLFRQIRYICESWSRAVSIATRLRIRRFGVRIPVETSLFSSPKRPDRLCGPPSFVFNGHRRSFQEVKRPGRKANDSPASSAEVKNEWSCISTSPLYLNGVGRDNFTLLVYTYLSAAVFSYGIA
jgi:hypothetical protein